MAATKRENATRGSHGTLAALATAQFFKLFFYFEETPRRF
jgi:hypothetical protein